MPEIESPMFMSTNIGSGFCPLSLLSRATIPIVPRKNDRTEVSGCLKRLPQTQRAVAPG